MRTLAAAALSAVAACSSQVGPPSTASVSESSTRLDQLTCLDTGPGTWDSAFLPQQTGTFSATFALANEDGVDDAIDAVAGFANAPADAFTDLGPIIRLAPDGFVDARNGGAYQRDAAISYTQYAYDPYVWVRMDVDLAAHTYSAWVNHDGHPDVVQIAHDYAFRTEQAGLARIDSVGRYIDSDTGTLRICDLAVTPSVCTQTQNQQPWVDTAFPAQSGAFTVEVDAWEIGARIDGVIGLAAAAPQAFTDLGPIVRFNAGGGIDARDGDTYRSDATIRYQQNGVYRIRFDVDVPSHTYSVTVRGPGIGSAPVALATGYHFRTEQQNVTSLASLGEFVDELADPPTSTSDQQYLEVCDLTAMY